MKQQKLKRVLCGLLVVCLLVSCAGMTGCSGATSAAVEPMEPEEVNTLTFDLIGGKDVMPISGYYSPARSKYFYNGESQPDMITDEYFKMIAESGINLLNQSYVDYNAYPNDVFATLDLGEKYGIGIFVQDPVVTGALGDKTMDISTMAERVSQYANHPAFCGIYGCDEPQWHGFYLGDGTRTIDMYAPSMQRLAELGIVVYANALPDNFMDDGGVKYTAYLNEMLDKFQSPYLSFDAYMWDANYPGLSRYFYNLGINRQVAQERNLPLWSFIQCGSQWNDSMNRFDSVTPYYPDEGQFQWSVNVNLAYGVQGIEYFTIIQPNYFAWAESEPFDFERNGMIGAWGNKNRWYYYAQTVNKQIAAVDEVLMHAKNKGVIVTSKQGQIDNAQSSAILEGESWRELVSVDGDAMIGCFNYQGKTALYVVNYDYEYAQDITLHFNDKHNVSVTYDAETAHYNAKDLTLKMQCGRGALVVFD